MRPNHRKKTVITVLLIINLMFIFGNSVLSLDKSKAVSTAVVNVIEKVTGISLTVEDDTVSDYSTEHYIRKAAHMTEFALLGILCVLLFMFEQFSVTRFKSLVIMGLSVPLLDEGIQFFSERGYALTDVYIDIVGFAIGAGIMLFIKKLKKQGGQKTA